jgi:multiple sugar transport system permease protein
MKKISLWQWVIRYALVIIVTVVALFPTYWMVTMAFKPKGEWTSASGTVYWVPRNPTLDNFRSVLTDPTRSSKIFTAQSQSGLPSIKNSIVVAVGGTLFAMILGTLAAYGISRYHHDSGDFPWYIALGRLLSMVLVLLPLAILWSKLGLINKWYGIISLTVLGFIVDGFIGKLMGMVYKGAVGNLAFSILQLRMFPPIAIMIPVMIMWSTFRLVDTWYGLVLIYGIVTFPFTVWLMRSFFDEVPRELDEAAIVDGASTWGAFFKVVLPLAKGGLAATALFVFILNWSDFLIALLLTNRDWTTIPVFLNKMVTADTGAQHGPKAALGTIAAIPPVVFGIMIQRYLVRGLTFGAIKK